MQTTTDFIHDATRYQFDANLLPEGFRQWDTEQDASYFGVWVHPERMVIITFAEGDFIRQEADNRDEFRAELARMVEVYGPAPHYMSTIDADGTLTRYVETRYMGD